MDKSRARYFVNQALEARLYRGVNLYEIEIDNAREHGSIVIHGLHILFAMTKNYKCKAITKLKVL